MKGERKMYDAIILDCSHYCPYYEDCNDCPRNEICKQELEEYQKGE